MTVEYYARLLRDTARVELFRRAIEAVVRPGDTVVDVGSGLGTFSLFAARAGARKVYAIEGGAVRDLLRGLVADNGLAERIEVIGEAVQDVRLDRRADVLITEDFSRLLLSSELEQLLLGPRRALLQDGGRIIPSKARMCLAPAECRRELAERDPWRDPGFGYGLRWERLRDMAQNLVCDTNVLPEQLLAEPQVHTELVTTTFEETSFRRSLTFTIGKRGLLTALAGWFECELCPGVTLSNAPGAAFLAWRQSLLLLPPVDVAEGDRVEVEVALLRDPDARSFWAWQGVVRTAAGATSFERSTFRATPLSRESLGRSLEPVGSVPAAPAPAPAKLQVPTGPIRRAPEVLARDLDDERVLYDTRTGAVFSLNGTARRVWDLCDGSRRRDRIVAALRERFDVQREVIEEDVDGLLASFRERGLIQG